MVCLGQISTDGVSPFTSNINSRPRVEECYTDVINNPYQTGISGICNGTILNSYSKGEIKARTNAGYSGICHFGEAHNCYTITKLPSSNSFPISYNGTSDKCFWAEETSGISTGNNGTKVTVPEMKTKSTFTDAGWDFDTIWEMDPTTGYPRLQWEKNIR